MGNKNNLGNKVLNVIKNSWKAIPWVGFVNYIESGYNKDLEKEVSGLKIAGKIYGSFGWSTLASVYLMAGATGSSLNPVNQMNSFIEYLKKQEQCQIDASMGIQNSSKTYVPSFEDWERAYNKIKSS